MTTATELEVSTRWAARGFTDEVTSCEHCGKADLKGTVRMVEVNQDGEVEGETFMGVTCAARMTGRKATEIRTEAARADREREQAIRATYGAWSDARHRVQMDAGDLVLAAHGIDRSVKALAVIDADPGYQATIAAWDSANPRPQQPWLS